MQDVKAGQLRYYPMASVLHYGAVPRTYEHPHEKDDLTGLSGDGDPVDIVDVSDLPSRPGEVVWVKVLGALAMEDDGAADWKIVGIRLSDPRAALISGACLWQLPPRPARPTAACTGALPAAMHRVRFSTPSLVPVPFPTHALLRPLPLQT